MIRIVREMRNVSFLRIANRNRSYLTGSPMSIPFGLRHVIVTVSLNATWSIHLVQYDANVYLLPSTVFSSAVTLTLTSHGDALFRFQMSMRLFVPMPMELTSFPSKPSATKSCFSYPFFCLSIFYFAFLLLIVRWQF